MKKLNEIGIGSFRPGDNSLNIGRHLSPVGLAGPSTPADSHFSRRSQSPPNIIIDDEEVEDDEDIILECRVYKNGKYCLIETLENLAEFRNYAADATAMMQRIQRQSQKRKDSVERLPDLEDKIDEEVIDEFSGSAALGGVPVPPVGYTAKGKPETRRQRRKRQTFNVEKSYPYTK